MDYDQWLLGPFRSVERLLKPGRWDVVEAAVRAVVVVPVGSGQGGEFDVYESPKVPMEGTVPISPRRSP